MILSPLILISQKLSPISRSKPRYMLQPIHVTYCVRSSTRKRRPAKDTERGPGRCSRSRTAPVGLRVAQETSAEESWWARTRVPFLSAELKSATESKTCLL